MISVFTVTPIRTSSSVKNILSKRFSTYFFHSHPFYEMFVVSGKFHCCNYTYNVEIKNSARNGRRRPWPTPKDDDATMHSTCKAAMTALSSFAHSVLMRCLSSSQLRRDQSCVFSTSFIIVCPPHCRQLDLNPANLKVTVEAEWILAFLFPATSR